MMGERERRNGGRKLEEEEIDEKQKGEEGRERKRESLMELLKRIQKGLETKGGVCKGFGKKKMEKMEENEKKTKEKKY